MLLVASAGYGAVRGGHVPQILENLQNVCDAVANKAGFRIAEVALTGEHEVGREDDAHRLAPPRRPIALGRTRRGWWTSAHRLRRMSSALVSPSSAARRDRASSRSGSR